jgi:hypothetical protein
MPADPLKVPLHALHPTQITVGMIEVHDKMQLLRDLHSHEQHQYLEVHPMPVVSDANHRFFIIDHHHMARALWETGAEHAYIVLECELPPQSEVEFWQTLMQRHWAHPINEHGERRPYREVPRHVQELRDDVYRSLAAFVREAGGYHKTPTPFAEFVWADWFRPRITVGASREEFQRAVERGVRLAKSAAARDLPGYAGEIT